MDRIERVLHLTRANVEVRKNCEITVTVRVPQYTCRGCGVTVDAVFEEEDVYIASDKTSAEISMYRPPFGWLSGWLCIEDPSERRGYTHEDAPFCSACVTSIRRALEW